jgi:hypothetical protein
MQSTLTRPGHPRVLSPRGYYYAHTLDDAAVEILQQQLKQLLETRSSDTPTQHPWQYYKTLIALTKQCFPNSLGQWVLGQKDSPYLYGRRLECLFDLITFIDTGKRALTVRYWYELLDDYPSAQAQHRLTQSTQRALERSGCFHQPISKTIIQWCRQPLGVEDMLWTLIVFFGVEKPTTPAAQQTDRLSSFSPVRPL